MDKYTEPDDVLLFGLRDEEASLMQTVQAYLAVHDLSADDQQKFKAAQSRLLAVRDKITELDLKRFEVNSGKRS